MFCPGNGILAHTTDPPNTSRTWANDQRSAEKKKKNLPTRPSKMPRTLTVGNCFDLSLCSSEGVQESPPTMGEEVKTNPRVSRDPAQSSLPKVKMSFLMPYF